jgi:hypothetical protein
MLMSRTIPNGSCHKDKKLIHHKNSRKIKEIMSIKVMLLNKINF